MARLLLTFGSDTSVCFGSSVTFNAGAGYSSYAWSTGETSSSISANTVDTYIVNVTDAYGCENSDTVAITTVYAIPPVNLGTDLLLCTDDEEILSSSASTGTYLWQDGSDSPTLTVNANSTGAGTYTYWLEVTNSNGCKNSDTIEVVISLPVADLGDDTIVCEGSFLTLSTADIYDSYVWQDGSSGNTYLISTSSLGIGDFDYWVEVTDALTCTHRDSMVLSVIDCSSVNELGLNEELVSIYPNPVVDVLRLELNENADKFRIKLLNAQGQILFEKHDSQRQLIEYSMEELPSGIYFLSVEMNAQQLFYKVVKKKSVVLEVFEIENLSLE